MRERPPWSDVCPDSESRLPAPCLPPLLPPILSISINLRIQNFCGFGQLQRSAWPPNLQRSRYRGTSSNKSSQVQGRCHYGAQRIAGFNEQAPAADRLAACIPRGKKSLPQVISAPATARSISWLASRPGPIGRRFWAHDRLLKGS